MGQPREVHGRIAQGSNRGILGHYVANASLATGAYETLNNFIAAPPQHPTVFEYFRKDLNRPSSDAWVIAPSIGFERIGESHHAAYGPGLGANVVLPKRLLASAIPAGARADYESLLHDNYESPLYQPEAGQNIELERLTGLLKVSVSDFLASAKNLESPDELSVFIARQIPATDPAVLSITKIEAGSAYNIIPDEVQMIGTLRTLSQKTREKARAGLTRIAENIAIAHGCTADVRIDDGYPVTMCDPRAVSLLKQISEDLEPGQWQPMPAPIMGGEDFSYVLREVPGAMAFIGVAPEGSEPAKNPPLHNTKMTIEESVMAKGIAMHCAYAERFLENGFD